VEPHGAVGETLRGRSKASAGGNAAAVVSGPRHVALIESPPQRVDLAAQANITDFYAEYPNKRFCCYRSNPGTRNTGFWAKDTCSQETML